MKKTGVIIIAENKKDEPVLPTNDFLFKKLFGSIGNEKITQNLIESIIEKEIGDIDLGGNTILEKELIDDKGCVLDVKAKLDNGEMCDLEMQVSDQHNIEDRILTYWSMLFLSTLKSGNDYTAAKRTIVIFITKYKIENMKKLKQCHTKWRIREEKNHQVILTNKLELHIIQLPNKVYGEKEKLNNNLMLWLKFIENPKELGELEMEENEAIAKAKEKYDKLSEDEEIQWLARKRELFLSTQEQTYNSGVEYGREQGKTEGRVEGEKAGEKRGKKIKAIEIAKELLNEGLDINKVASITGLSKEEIDKLEK